MIVKPGTALNVSLQFDPQNVVPVGRLVLDRGIAVLGYNAAFIASGLTLNPNLGPAGTGVVRAINPRAFSGLHGVFADSLPDAWGAVLMRRRAAEVGFEYNSLTVLDRLAMVGRRGMGALIYEPDVPVNEDGVVDLDRLASESVKVLAGDESSVVRQLEALGGSSGGARPKVLVAIDRRGHTISGVDNIPSGYDGWIVKFPSSADVRDIGPLEVAYADMARAAGLDVSETKLIGSATGPGYFATKRFDRAPGNARIHALSFAAFLDTDWSIPSTGYETLMNVTRGITREQPQVEKIFRRMTFNVIARNRDDHAKQHAFLMESSGKWKVAPSYDLTFSPGPGGQHYLTVAGEGDEITVAHIMRVAAAQSISPSRAKDIVEEVTTAVNDFEKYAGNYGVSRSTIQSVRRGLSENQKLSVAAKTPTTHKRKKH
ncbi:MAG: type II toxin-antitoxin system HipA family toxin [Candidatus Velthaea sp.]